MFIILLAHTPGNLWTRWIPARWGFSDATEMFVFCSGMASAIAFGKLFQNQGLQMGTARITFRIWQVYWAHLGLFFFTLMSLLATPHLGFTLRDYVGQLNLIPFLNNVEGNLIGLMTLTYVPNYFDILPMYLVILAMIPLMMALAKIHPYVALGACLVMWGAANMELAEFFTDKDITQLQLPAQLWFEEGQNTRPWFFNPFGWQLCFFTGFALMIGWIPRPPVNKWCIGLALAIVIASFIFSAVGARSYSWHTEWWDETIRSWQRETFFSMDALRAKTDFGLFRYLHMLALGYLAWVLVGEDGKYLKIGRVWSWIVANIIMKVGQQSLAVFIFSMLLARWLGIWLDEMSTIEGNRFVRDPWINTFVNLFGFALLVGCAYVAGWFKSSPWKPRRPKEAKA